jgi:alpha-ketoglutarate-dependent taurine dioxygenase
VTALSTVDAFDARSHETIRRELGGRGAILLHSFTLGRFHQEMGSLGRVFRHPHADQHGVTLVRPTTGAPPSERGLSREMLTPHTDRAQVDLPPGVVGLLCLEDASSGGTSLLIDFEKVLDRLATLIPVSELARLLRIKIIGSGALLPMLWRERNGNYCVRYRDDEIAQPFSYDQGILVRLRELTTKLQLEVRLSPGDGYIISNHRWLHGRTAFCGRRLMTRILVAQLYRDDLDLGMCRRAKSPQRERSDVRA